MKSLKTKHSLISLVLVSFFIKSDILFHILSKEEVDLMLNIDVFRLGSLHSPSNSFLGGHV